MTEELAGWTVAAAFEVTVRTLHHYDAIGLLTPSERSLGGYRRYNSADLARLQQIAVYRRLEMPLKRIGEPVDGHEDATAHLLRQRAAVMSRLEELHGLVEAIDQALAKKMSNQQMTETYMKNLFGSAFDDSYAAEARQRWGDTAQWAQSQQRTVDFTRADRESVKAEADSVSAAFAAAMDAGEPTDSAAAMAAAEAHRARIERFFDGRHSCRQRSLSPICDPRG